MQRSIMFWALYIFHDAWSHNPICWKSEWSRGWWAKEQGKQASQINIKDPSKSSISCKVSQNDMTQQLQDGNCYQHSPPNSSKQKQQNMRSYYQQENPTKISFNSEK